MKKVPILTMALSAVAAITWVVISAIGTHPVAADAAGKTPGKPKAQAEISDDKGNANSQQSAEPSGMTVGELLRQAREKLHGYRSVKARLIETVVIGDRKFQARGTYLQGLDFKLKMSLDVRLGPDGMFRGSMLQVCDGQVLWTSHIFSKPRGATGQSGESQTQPEFQQRITRRDIRQIIAETARRSDNPQNRLIAELGIGGLSELLASLEKTMVFGRVRQERIDGKPFLVVQGRWNADVLKNFLNAEELEQARSAGEGRLLPRLPEHVPDAVRIYFDRDRLFPRRILYLKRPPAHDSLRPMLALNLVDVVLNGPVDESEFHFVPPDKVFPQDVTQKYLKQLR